MLATLLWLACQAKVEPVAASPAPAAAPDAPPPAAPPAPASAPPCGGFAGFRCPEDLTCVDDTTDACHPGRGAKRRHCGPAIGGGPSETLFSQ